MERLAAYLTRASFSQERMDSFPEQATVIFHSKDGKEKKTYDALEWIAGMGTHMPLRGEQMVYSQRPPHEEDFSSQVPPWDSDF